MGLDGVLAHAEPVPNLAVAEAAGDQTGVDLDRVLDDQEAILGHLQDGDEQAAGQALQEDVAPPAQATCRGPRDLTAQDAWASSEATYAAASSSSRSLNRRIPAWASRAAVTPRPGARWPRKVPS